MAERIAIVVPRCANSVHGGAEVLALTLARDLMPACDVEILTTCALDYLTWENTFPEGPDTVEGVRVRRFAVDAPRDTHAFDVLSRTFRYRIASLSIAEQESWMRAQGPYSTTLLRHLAEHRTAYDAFIFLPYLYATTYFGLPLVRDRAILMPLAHDEWMLYLPIWEPFVRDARALVFVTPEERDLMTRRFRQQQIVGPVVHPGIASSAPGTTRSLDREHPYMLYLGRVDDSKGVRELCERFIAHAHRFPQSPWHLVVAGPGTPPVTHPRITFLGAIDEETKWSLLSDCDLFVMPSYYESLSLSMAEAWKAGRAALVNGWNTVLVGQAQRAGGGLWYHDQPTFDAVLDALDEPTRARLGAQGRSYVERTYAQPDTLAVIRRAASKLGAWP